MIPEKTCLLFQTKIESTVTKNNRTEFKIVKNSIFDTTQYDLLKWSIDHKYVMGYKLREGACILFSKDPNDVREFKYVCNDDKTVLAPSGAFSLKSRDSSIYKRVDAYDDYADSWRMHDREESLRTFKEKTEPHNDVHMKYIYKNKELEPHDGAVYESYYGQNSGMQSYMSNLARHRFPPQIITDNNPNAQQNTATTTSSFSTSNASLDPGNPLINNSIRGSGLFGNATFSSNKKEIATNTNFIPNAVKGSQPDFNLSGSVPIAKKSDKKDKKFEPYPDSKKDDHKEKKLSKREKKDRLLEKKDEAKKTVPEKVESLDKKEKVEEIAEEKIIEDIIKGSFIRVVHSIQLNKSDNCFCYDHSNKIYYILANISLVSASILVSSTLETNYETLSQITTENTGISIEKVLKSFANIEKVDFEEFTENLTDIMIILQTKKPDNFWKYTNWNYYYNFLLENINHVRNSFNF